MSLSSLVIGRPSRSLFAAVTSLAMVAAFVLVGAMPAHAEPALPAYSLNGTVTDSVTNAPLEGVQVWVQGYPDMTSFEVLSVVTDANGYYEITGIPENSISIGLDASETHRAIWTESYTLVTETTAFDAQLVPNPSGIGSVTGVVLDFASSEPLADVMVSASTMSGFNKSLTTSADGRYEFTGIPLEAVSIYTSKTGFGSAQVTLNMTATNHERMRDITLKPLPTGTSEVSGAVLESDGDGGLIPVTGIRVVVNSTNMADSTMYGSTAVTGAGEFQIGNLPQGSYTLAVFPEDFSQVDVFQQLDYEERTVTVDGTNSVVKNLELVRVPTGAGSVSGTLKDRRTGDLISGAQVSISHDSGALHKGTITSNLGEWRIENLPDGTYGLQISDMAHEQQWEWEGFTITDGEHVVRNETMKSVAPGTSTLTGRVKDRDTHEGINGLTVSLQRIMGGFPDATTTTDSKGDYSLSGIPAGAYSLNISGAGFDSERFTVDIIDDEAATFNAPMQAIPPIPDGEGTISGVVRDSDANPVAGASVSAHATGAESLGSLAWGWAVTDSDGYFELSGLAITPVALSINAGGYVGATSTVALTTSEPAAVRDFTLVEAASISGTVSGSGGALEALVFAADGNPLWGSMVGSDGTYRIEGLPAGEYVVKVFPSSQAAGVDPNSVIAASAYWASGSVNGAVSLDDATSIHLGVGEDSGGHDIELVPGGKISGTVVVETPDGSVALPQGRAVTVKAVKLVGTDWEVQDFTYTLASQFDGGTYLLAGLAPGSYKLQFTDEWTGNRAYATRYNGGATSLAAAPVITITGSPTITGVDAAMSVPIPSAGSSAVPTNDLNSSTEGLAGTSSDAAGNEELTIGVGQELAGEYVSVWAHSTPTPLTGWVKVASDGTVKAVVDAGLPAGQHHLVVQDAADAVIGWSEITITPAPTSGGAGGGSGSTPNTPGASPTSGDGSATPRTAVGTVEQIPALDAIAETFVEVDDVEVPPTAEKPAPVAGGDSPVTPISDGGMNWMLWGGALFVVVLLGALGTVAVVRARRS